MHRTNNANKSFFVKVGDTVTYEFDDKIMTHTILQQNMQCQLVSMGGPHDTPIYKTVDETIADPNNGTIHEKSPVAQSMLGKKIGESFSVTVDGKTHLGKIVDICLDKVTYPINKITYTNFASGLRLGYLRSFTIEVEREKGITVKIDGRGYPQITDLVYISYAKLQSIFEQIDKIEFPAQRTYTSIATDGDDWLMQVDDVEYSGYFRRPDFVIKFLTIIDYRSYCDKYIEAFNKYISSCYTDSPQ